MLKNRRRLGQARRRRQSAARGVASGLIVAATLAGPIGTASAGNARTQQTDGGFVAFGVQGHWTINAYTPSSSATMFALHHFYFNLGQSSAGQNTNFINGPSGGPAFEEVGDLIGPLNNTSFNGLQFYWATCQDPSDLSHCGNINANYFEGPMAPAPSLVLGHSYQFKSVIEQHGDGTWWYDLFIRDLTTNGSWSRGGGRGSSTDTVCCTSAATWGGETSDAVHTTSPKDTVAGEQYEVGGSWADWGDSARYPPAGSAPYQVDDAVWDTGTDYTHTWISKYTSIKIGG